MKRSSYCPPQVKVQRSDRVARLRVLASCACISCPHTLESQQVTGSFLRTSIFTVSAGHRIALTLTQAYGKTVCVFNFVEVRNGCFSWRWSRGGSDL